MLVTATAASNNSWGISYPPPLPPHPLHYPWTNHTYDFTTLSALPATFEWNHNPDPAFYSLNNNTSSSRDGKGLILSTASLTADLYSARNTLTHRAHGEFPVGTVELDISGMKDGDRAGLAAFRDRSAYIGVHKETGDNKYTIAAVFNMTVDEFSGETVDLGYVAASVDVPSGVGKVWLRCRMDARASGTREARFSYSFDGGKTEWRELGGVYELYTGWAFFLGYRFGVFNHATRELGGSVSVLSFTSA
jgi:beta-xylosidase